MARTRPTSSGDDGDDFSNSKEFFASSEAAPAPVSPLSHVHITRRRKDFAKAAVGNSPWAYGVQPRVDAVARNIAAVQMLWREHAGAAAKLFPQSLWRLLDATKLESKTTQTKVLRACLPLLSPEDRKHWPKSRKRVDAKLNKLGSFHARITRRVTIDLTHYDLPGLHKPFVFTFMDPVFAWAICADKLSRQHEMYFCHIPATHPNTGEPMYGASVACGEIMRKACSKCPAGTAPALFGLGYDSGQASRRRSYTPVLISVGNSDYCGRESCVCIAYMPEIVIKGAAQNLDVAKEAMHELRQACIGAIVDVIEACAEHGFKCVLSEELSNGQHRDAEQILFPVLARMEFDTKERYKFFCCAKQRACGIGSGPRDGHSALRSRDIPPPPRHMPHVTHGI